MSQSIYPVICQIAPAEANVVNSIEIRQKMERKYIASLRNRFYNSISSPSKTMSVLKKQIKGKG